MHVNSQGSETLSQTDKDKHYAMEFQGRETHHWFIVLGSLPWPDFTDFAAPMISFLNFKNKIKNKKYLQIIICSYLFYNMYRWFDINIIFIWFIFFANLEINGKFQCWIWKHSLFLAEGTQIWVGQGCAARASKPLPIYKGDFGRKRYPFLRIFLEKYAHFSKILQFSGFSKCKNQKIWAQSEKLTHL